MESLTASQIIALIQRFVSYCFPGWDFCLSTRFAPYLSLNRDEILQIFLKNRQKTDLLFAQFLSGPLDRPALDEVLLLPLDLQVCLLDRLLFAHHHISLIKKKNGAEGSEMAIYRMPETLIHSGTKAYRKLEIRRWLSSNALPRLFELAPLLIQEF